MDHYFRRDNAFDAACQRFDLQSSKPTDRLPKSQATASELPLEPLKGHCLNSEIDLSERLQQHERFADNRC